MAADIETRRVEREQMKREEAEKTDGGEGDRDLMILYRQRR